MNQQEIDDLRKLASLDLSIEQKHLRDEARRKLQRALNTGEIILGIENEPLYIPNPRAKNAADS